MAPYLPDGPMVGLAQTWRDAMALLTDTRDYAAFDAVIDSEPLDPFERLKITTKAMQLTTCLIAIAAWLMSQRAVEAGEIDREEAQRCEHRLAQCPLCEEVPGEAIKLPGRLDRLARRTVALYRRLARLDRLADGDGP